MSRIKYLFLFAGFNSKGIVDDALVHYVSTLSKYGDVIVCMDCDCDKKEINKLKPFSIHQIAGRHGEYDFGSYKRAYLYAHDKNILKDYDYVYLLNDSVFGPMFDMEQILNKMQKSPFDACGIVVSKHKTHEFMESWFVQLNKKVFLSNWFYEFISSVKQEKEKYIITVKYEHGLTNVIKNNGCSWGGLYTAYGRKTYNNPKSSFLHGCPFIKKASFTRHNGALGKQINYILKHSDSKATKSVITSANNLYGEKYMNWFLTSNPIKILWRNITYIINKMVNHEKN